MSLQIYLNNDIIRTVTPLDVINYNNTFPGLGINIIAPATTISIPANVFQNMILYYANLADDVDFNNVTLTVDNATLFDTTTNTTILSAGNRVNFENILDIPTEHIINFFVPQTQVTANQLPTLIQPELTLDPDVGSTSATVEGFTTKRQGMSIWKLLLWIVVIVIVIYVIYMLITKNKKKIATANFND